MYIIVSRNVISEARYHIRSKTGIVMSHSVNILEVHLFIMYLSISELRCSKNLKLCLLNSIYFCELFHNLLITIKILLFIHDIINCIFTNNLLVNKTECFGLVITV